MLRPIQLINAARIAMEVAARAAAEAAAKAALAAAQQAQQQANQQANQPPPTPPAPPVQPPEQTQANTTPVVSPLYVAPADVSGAQAPTTGPRAIPTPALFTSGTTTRITNDLLLPQDGGAPTPSVQTVDAPVQDEQDTEAAEAGASEIVGEIRAGYSIDQIAEDRGMTPQEVIEALRSGGMTVTENAPTSDNGDVQTTTITQENGETVTYYYDYQHDSYHTEVTGANGETTAETPVRDGSGRIVTTSEDTETGQTTTTYEDDLGDGTVTEEVSMPDGTKVETVTPGTDPTGQGIQPTTTVTAPGGEAVELDPDQNPGGETTQSIQDALMQGQSIDQIAEDRGLTVAQVQAELQAAGYTVETTAATSSNGDVQTTTLTDANTGVEISYKHDWQHSQTTTITTDGDVVTTHSEDANGVTTDRTENTETGEVEEVVVDPDTQTTVTTVVDADGRKTVTTEVVQGDGKPNPIQVEEGDNLTAIAEAHGMTLEELLELNPHLAEGRDPDLINPGETIEVNDPVETTTEITFNGYTVTTAPDGGVTVVNEELGYEVEVEAGTPEAELAGLLVQVNPNSSDPEEAKKAETVLNLLEGLFAGEGATQLTPEAEELATAREEAIETHGEGYPVQEVVDSEGYIVDPYGQPPILPTESGGDWVPVSINGEMRWVDPEVARAVLEENALLAQISELQATALEASAQSNVYALDPDYTDAQEGAGELLNEVLNPHGLQWNLQKPDMTLEEAQTKLEEAQGLVEPASKARTSYEEAITALEEAIEANNDLEPILNADTPIVTAPGSPVPTREEREAAQADGEAEHAAVDELFAAVNLAIAEGDSSMLDLVVEQADYFGMDKTSEEYQNLVGMRDAAAGQVELAEAYSEYFAANTQFQLWEAERTDLEGQLLAEYNAANPVEAGKEYNRINGGYLGTFEDRYVESREDGQLWVVTLYSSGETVETQLTYSLNDENVKEEYRNSELNREWQEFLTSQASSAEVCTPNGSGPQTARAEAAIRLNEVWEQNTQNTIDNLETSIQPLQEQLNEALAEHGAGTTELPDGAMPDGVEPVSVEAGGQTIMVAPDLVDAVNNGDIDALAQSQSPIYVTFDFTPENGIDDEEGRWVAPEVALLALDLATTRQQISDLEDFKSTIGLMTDYHEFVRDNPDAADEDRPNALLDALENDRQTTLDGVYQGQFQALADAGLDGTFEQQNGTGLEDTIAQTLGLNPTDDEAEAIIDSVAEEIRDIGGDNPEVARLPLFYVDENGSHQSALFAVRDGEGQTYYVDITGKKFTDIEDFQNNNDQFSEDGQIIVAENLDMTAADDGTISLDVHQASIVSDLEKWVDPLVGVGTGVATVLSFTPAAPVAAPLAIAGATYLGGRAAFMQYEHISHGGEWTDGQSLMNIATVATTALPMGASGLRAITMARGGLLPAGSAFRYSVGAYSRSSPIAVQAQNFSQSTHLANRIAYGMDATAVGSGVPMLGISGYDLMVNGSEMNGLQLANAIVGLGTGTFGTGFGIHGLRTMRPGTAAGGESGYGNGNAGHSGTDPIVPDAVIQPGGEPGTTIMVSEDGGRPMVVQAAGPDGVYRPTGEIAYHDAAHPVIAGETVAGGGNQGESGPIIVDGSVTGSTARPALGAAPVNEFTLSQLFKMSTAERGSAGEVYISHLYDVPENVIRSGADARFAIPQDRGLDVRSGRNVDVPVESSWTQIIQALEVKNWRLWTNRNGTNQHQEVPLDTHIQKQVNADMALRDTRSDYQPRWIFIDAPPSPALLSALEKAGIPSNIYGRPLSPSLAEGTAYVPGPGNKPILATLDSSLGAGTSRMIRLNPNYVYRPGANETVPSAPALRESGMLGVVITDADGNPVVVGLNDARLPGRSETPSAPAEGVNPLADAPEGYLAIEAAPQRPAIEAGSPQPVLETDVSGTGQGETGQPAPSSAAEGTTAPAAASADGADAASADIAVSTAPAAATGGYSPAEAGALTRSQLQALGAEQVAALSPEAIAAIKPRKIKALDAAGIAGWDAAQIEALSPQQVSRLSEDQIKAMTASQFARFSDDQWTSLDQAQGKALTDEQLALVSEAHYAQIPDKALPKINSDAIGRQDIQYIGDYSADKLRVLNFDQIRALSPEQVAAIDPTQLWLMRADHIRKFSAEQFTWMTPEQRAGLSTEQVVSLRNTNRRTLTEEQKASLSPEERAALIDGPQGSLTDEQAQLFADTLKAARRREIKYFATSAALTSTGIAGVHFALPPQLSVPVAAAGLVVRGSVGAVQGMFKNTTYDNTTLGRILNGVYGASFLATGQSGFQNPAASLPSLAGSFLNSPKGAIRATSGQTMMRTWSTYLAEPLGLIGGITIIASNPGNPLAISAGTLIALRSGESIVRGIRTDQVRRAPFPTEKEGWKGLEDSNKRWDRSKMIAGLVGLVGVGGYVTSLLAEEYPQNSNQPTQDPTTPPPTQDPTVPTQPTDTTATPPADTDPSQDPTYPQFVVKPEIGLNLREEPEADAGIVTTFSSGTFVDQTGEAVVDEEGRSWIPVEGFGQDGSFGAGWVLVDHVSPHAEGESDAQGRYNPELEQEGHQWIAVSGGDTIRSIAIAHNVDIVDTVALNLDHIVEPDLVFEGDRIYLPAA